MRFFNIRTDTAHRYRENAQNTHKSDPEMYSSSEFRPSEIGRYDFSGLLDDYIMYYPVDRIRFGVVGAAAVEIFAFASDTEIKTEGKRVNEINRERLSLSLSDKGRSRRRLFISRRTKALSLPPVFRRGQKKEPWRRRSTRPRRYINSFSYFSAETNQSI